MYKIMYQEKYEKRWRNVYFQNTVILIKEKTLAEAKKAVQYFSAYSPSRKFKAVKI